MLERKHLSNGRSGSYFGVLHDMGIHLTSLYDGFVQATGCRNRLIDAEVTNIQAFAATHLEERVRGKPAAQALDRLTYIAFKVPASESEPELVFEFGKRSSSGDRKLVRVRRDFDENATAMMTYDIGERRSRTVAMGAAAIAGADA